MNENYSHTNLAAPHPLGAAASPQAVETAPAAAPLLPAAAGAQNSAEREPILSPPSSAAPADLALATALGPLLTAGRLVWAGKIIRRHHADSALHIHDLLNRLLKLHVRGDAVIGDTIDMIAALTLRAHGQAMIAAEAIERASIAERALIARGKRVAAAAGEQRDGAAFRAAITVFINAETERAELASRAGQAAEAKARFQTAEWLTALIANPQGAQHG